MNLVPKVPDMYGEASVVSQFVRLEANEKNRQMALMLERLLIGNLPDDGALYIANLGAGAHPEQYHDLYRRLNQHMNSRLDWVDQSNLMLSHARQNTVQIPKSLNHLNFIEADFFEYLSQLPDHQLDAVMMRNAFGYVQDLNLFFQLLNQKLKPTGAFISTYDRLDPELPAVVPVARFAINGESIPIGEAKILKDGDTYTISFFESRIKPDQITDESQLVYLKGAETTKYYFSPKTVLFSAAQHGLEGEIKDWQTLLADDQKADLDQLSPKGVIVLRKENNRNKVNKLLG